VCVCVCAYHILSFYVAQGDRYVELFLLNEGGGVAGRGYGSK
jgi:hypothetical protein